MRPVTDNTKASPDFTHSRFIAAPWHFLAMVVAKFSQLFCKIASMESFKKMDSTHARKTKKRKSAF